MPKLVPSAPSRADSLMCFSPHLQRAVSTLSQAAYSNRTLRAYERAWHEFSAWCARQHVQDLPAQPHVIAAWMAAHASGVEGAKWSHATIALALAGVVAVHRAAGYDIDRGHVLIRAVFKGASRRLALERPVRKAAPLMRDDLVAILAALNDHAKDRRDAALLSVGWSGALRGGEIVGLDWIEVRQGPGALDVDASGITVRLLISKTSGGRQQSFHISRREAPSACEAVQAWVAISRRKKGDPLFTSVDRHGGIGLRLTARSLSRIVQDRMLDRLMTHGLANDEAVARSKLYCGHSLRAGFISSAVAFGVPEAVIQARTRHRSAEILRGYVRGAALAPTRLEELAL